MLGKLPFQCSKQEDEHKQSLLSKADCKNHTNGNDKNGGNSANSDKEQDQEAPTPTPALTQVEEKEEQASLEEADQQLQSSLIQSPG
jgi:hypothetical protein